MNQKLFSSWVIWFLSFYSNSGQLWAQTLPYNQQSWKKVIKESVVVVKMSVDKFISTANEKFVQVEVEVNQFFSLLKRQSLQVSKVWSWIWILNEKYLYCAKRDRESTPKKVWLLDLCRWLQSQKHFLLCLWFAFLLGTSAPKASCHLVGGHDLHCVYRAEAMSRWPAIVQSELQNCPFKPE